jgi:hypothetical protein
VGAGKFDHSGRTRILFKNIPAPAQPPSAAVLTYHNDNARTGLNPLETGLSPSAVSLNGMKPVYVNSFTSNPPGSDAEVVSAQVLYAPQMNIRGVTRYPFFVFTTQNEIFSWDLGPPGTDSGQFLYAYGFPDFEDGRDQTNKRPAQLGIWGTPVIDYATRTIYFVTRTGSMTPVSAGMDPAFQSTFYLVAWDIEREGWKAWVKIEGSYPDKNGVPLMFAPENHSQRAALLLDRGSIYVGFGSQWQEEQHAYHGWLFRYDAETFEQRGAFCTSPNEYAKDANGNYTGVDYPGKGAGIWMAGGGPAADSFGQVYLETGNGPSNASNATYGDHFLKLSPRGYTLQLLRATPGDNATEDLFNRDWDLGGGGPVVVEASSRVVGGGKEGKYYVLDMNTFQLQQSFQGYNNLWFPNWPTQAPGLGFWWGSPHLHGQPVLYNGTFFHQAEMDYLRGFKFNGSLTTSGALVTNDKRIAPLSLAYMRAQLSASANGSTANTGVVWSTVQAIDDGTRRSNPRAGCNSGIATVNRVSAHDATTLNCLWSDNLDVDPNPGAIAKQSPPTVVGSRLILVTPKRGSGVTRQVRVYMPGASGKGRDCPTDLPAIPSPPCN